MIRRSWMIGASIETTRELWASSLREVKKRIRPLFAQERAALNAGLFVDGLFGDERRKTGWMRAEAAGDPGPWRQQAVLGRDRWDADALRDLVRDYATEHLADENAVLVADDRVSQARQGIVRSSAAICWFGGQNYELSDRCFCCLRVASRPCFHRSGALFAEGLDRRSGSPEGHICAGQRQLFDQASACGRDDRARPCGWRAVPLGCGR